jgi:hypothetical protein
MHTAWYSAAVPNAPPLVLKLRMRPYCLGHEILLRRFNSPFAAGADERQSKKAVSKLFGEFTLPPITPDDLVLACLICCQSFEGALKTLESRWLSWLLRIWRWRLGRRVDWTAEIAAFCSYRIDGVWMPEINRKPNQKTLASPWQFRLLVILMENFRMSESEALNFPMAKAHLLYCARGEMEGNVDLFSEDDEALLNKVAEMDAAKL